MKTITIIMIFIGLLCFVIYGSMLLKGVIKSRCELLFMYRYDNFNWEKDYEEGKLISWNANKRFNELCKGVVDYQFPENLEELNALGERTNEN